MPWPNNQDRDRTTAMLPGLRPDLPTRPRTCLVFCHCLLVWVLLASFGSLTPRSKETTRKEKSEKLKKESWETRTQNKRRRTRWACLTHRLVPRCCRCPFRSCPVPLRPALATLCKQKSKTGKVLEKHQENATINKILAAVAQKLGPIAWNGYQRETTGRERQRGGAETREFGWTYLSKCFSIYWLLCQCHFLPKILTRVKNKWSIFCLPY